MAIKYLDGGRITGLSTDAKPDRDTSDTTNPALTVQAGSVFIETDTGAKYVHNGTGWIQQTFDSINEARGKSNGVTQRQWFQEWFTGNSLNTDIWTRRDVAQSNSGAMYDGVNGGYRFANSTSGSYSWQNLDFNNNRQFSQYSSVIIGVMATLQGSGGGGISLCLSNTTGTGEENSACLKNDTGENANILGMCKNASNTSTAATSTARKMDGTFFAGKIELGASSYKYSVNGVHEATISTNLPVSDMQPKIMSISRSSGNQIYNYITYCEAFNT